MAPWYFDFGYEGTDSCGCGHSLFTGFQINCRTLLDNFCRVAMETLDSSQLHSCLLHFYGASDANNMCDCTGPVGNFIFTCHTVLDNVSMCDRQ
jgi:hypothetical protein